MVLQPLKILPHLRIEHGMTVMDMGSSVGFWSKRIAEIVGPTGRVIAVDYHPEIVQRLNHDAADLGMQSLHAVRGDIHNLGDLPVKQHSCDRVLLIRMLPVIQSDIHDRLMELLRYTNDQGELIIIDSEVYRNDIEDFISHYVKEVQFTEIPEIYTETDEMYFGFRLIRQQ